MKFIVNFAQYVLVNKPILAGQQEEEKLGMRINSD